MVVGEEEEESYVRYLKRSEKLLVCGYEEPEYNHPECLVSQKESLSGMGVYNHESH